ncbi:collagen binding domain-containing protein, partial [Paenibacillus typhae]|uniref:collagen binding domain-containing protein n=1 Tax=Paenibacillus typhae TaxID=1174501 RepID=UPI001C8DA89D
MRVIRQNKWAIWLGVVMLVTAFATAIGFFSNVNADAAETQITEDIVKSVTLSVYENGTQVTSNVYKLDSTVKLNLTYELPDAKYGEGATYTYTLPSQLKIDQTYSGTLVNSEFADGVGTYTVGSDNKVVFKFNKNIDGLFDIKGSFWVESKLSSTTVTGSTTQVLPFPIAGNASNTITLQIQPNNGKAVSKSGVPLPQKYNASAIEWTVDVNTSLSRLANASVTDTIPTGLDLNTVSIAVYGLNVDVQGNVTQGGQLDPALYDTSASTARNLNLKFNNTINEAYRVKFSTRITDTSKSSFTNTATLNGNGASQSGTSSAVGVSYGKPLEKTAGSYNSTTETISWQIKFNYDEKTITADKAVLTDYFNISQDYVPASLKIFKVKLDQNGSGTDDGQLTAGTDYTVTTLPDTATAAGFKIQFNSDIQSAYRIVYDTKVADRVYSGESIVNKVTYNGQTVQASASTSQRILNKQSPSGVNYLNKTVNWTIKVNEDNRTMTNLLLTDKFDNAGLMLIGKPAISPALVENVDYTITNLGSGDFSVNDGFQIKFLKPITEAYTITYSTEFDYYKLKTASSYFRNTASIVWDEKTTTGAQTSAQTFTPRTEVIKNGLKSGSYNATSKTITWKVGANYNKRALAAGAEMVDTLPVSQQMAGGDAGSVKVYELTYTSNGNPVQGSLVNAAEYEAGVTSDGRKLKVKFKNDIDYAFYVVFDTEFIAGDINLDKVTNTAILNDAQSNAVSETLTSPEVSVPNGGQYVTKTGTRDSSDQTIINWTMTINANQSVVGNAQVVDTPSTNQVLLPASFQLFETTVNSSGAVTATSVKLAQGTDYTIEFLTDSSGKDIFKLTFKNTISEPYVLKYQSVITAVGTVAVTNAVSFTGTGSKAVSKPFSYSNSFTIVDTGGTGSGVKGSLKVLKTNADQSLILPGAEFSLGRIVGSELKETKYATSDSGGNLEFKDLRAGKYILKETKAPAGYAVDTTERTVTINSSTPVLLTVTNDFNGSLKVTKVAKDNAATKLAGAVFELYNAANTLVGSGTTNASGEVIFTKLMGGSYTLKETKAPDGYVITAGSTAVTIDPAQQKTLTVTNDKIVLGSLKLTKVDSANPAKKLAGAEFQLYDASKALVATATTDANGVVEFKDLKLGAYTFKETVAPSGYALDSAERSVNITSAVQIVQQITNNELLGSIKLTKVDDDNTAKKLSGAEFKLYNASDVMVATATTDANGVVEFKDLKLGAYIFKETVAPVGY